MEDDQAALMGMIAQAHLRGHGGELDPNCTFCREFLTPREPVEYPLESYRLVWIDLSKE